MCARGGGSYERTAPLINGTAVAPGAGGIVHVTVGTGGGFFPEWWTAEQPAWSLSRIIECAMPPPPPAAPPSPRVCVFPRPHVARPALTMAFPRLRVWVS